ncbi:hypothetical protein KIH87_18905 [Paraneptunicella aestuarii]|uniref:hypothetical protein n=1 Tax=Paraneptunicella aestuarii TaxID=2831148 RepID=UPI001E38D024|nr:hypothetical protein [Paraneptunicella aestuarii]UAA38704.1 hypothetical protein KIH87_18905 [Paraneptunicella aestuarii]
MNSLSRFSPIFISLCYCLASSLSVVCSSFFEGTLLVDNLKVVNGINITQHAYVNNYSTIINFVLLNPLGIYFLLNAENGYKQSSIYFQNEMAFSKYHKLGLTVLSSMIGSSLMYFYFDGFIGGNFFTAAFEPDGDGKAVVSITGIFIFFWTALYMSFLFYNCIRYGQYILYIRERNIQEFGISLSTKVHRSIAIAIYPCVQVMYAITTIFLVMIIFMFRDYIQFEIDESRRVWLFAPYLLVGICSALPFFHLHKIMAAQKEVIVNKSANEVERRFLNNAVSTNWQSIKLDNILKAADSMDKTEKLSNILKVWPVQLKTLTMPNISFAISLFTLMYKLLSVFTSTQTV